MGFCKVLLSYEPGLIGFVGKLYMQDCRLEGYMDTPWDRVRANLKDNHVVLERLFVLLVAFESRSERTLWRG